MIGGQQFLVNHGHIQQDFLLVDWLILGGMRGVVSFQRSVVNVNLLAMIHP